MTSIKFLLIILTIPSLIIGKKITCNFYHHPSLGKTCKVNSLETDVITGIENLNEGNPDEISIFEATSKTLRFMPKGIADNFKNVVGIKLNFDNLVELIEDDLKPFGNNFIYLSITKSKIKVIPSNLFASTKNINTVYFDSSEMMNIEEGTFEKLTLLNVLAVKYPKCGVSEEETDREGVLKLIGSLNNRCRDPSVKFVPINRVYVDDVESNGIYYIIGVLVFGILAIGGGIAGWFVKKRRNSSENPRELDKMNG